MAVSLLELCNLCEKIKQVSGKNIKTSMVADFLRKTSSAVEASFAVYFIVGKIPPEIPPLNVGYSLVYDAIRHVSGISDKQFLREYSRVGDLGEVVESVFRGSHKTQRLFVEESVTIKEFYDILRMVGEVSGKNSRIKKARLIESFMVRLSPVEAKYFVKNLVGEMRHGVSEGLMEEAISKAFNIPVEKVRFAHMVTGRLGYVCEVLKSEGVEGLEKISLKPFQPLKPMLADMAKSVDEAISTHGGKTSFEFKLDGIRVQIHKKSSEVRIFSRRLKDVTENFPEIVEKIGREVKASSLIMEGEIIPVTEKGEPLPFQYVMRRYGRIKDLEETLKNVPVTLYVFDVLYLDGKPLVNKPFLERRKILDEIVPSAMLTPQIITSDAGEAESFFRKAVEIGHEGLIAKQLNSTYTPGVRGKKWLKIKKVMETLDLVILAAEYGHGRRHQWLSDYYLGVKNSRIEKEGVGEEKSGAVSFPDYIERFNQGRFKVVGKTFKGLTDNEIRMITDKLKKIVLEQHGRTVIVKPEIVVEVAFSDIQKSPLYSCGYALRFARITRIRNDKNVEEIDDIEKVEKMYRECVKT
ncbi:MAG: DNA ligase [Candidatus Hecatellales archaeon]|nr:MAG: DNA ligase [Candidatus Hecatellales archaeon]